MSVGKIRISDDLEVEVVDPHNIQPVYVDLVTELRVNDGVLYLSFANVVVDGESHALSRKAQVCARLRISGRTAEFIKNVLSQPEPEQAPAGQKLN
ncbi:hypothetical protein J3P71_09345 [Rhizobium leguminosarum]|uniref:hypothetical protein n=1 Tax=Rhizobium leguminosarum TaxID=384 RepID=UPI0014416DB5|nr:hypothetical protein [Rhizobium leguminosarum]MBY5837085.1 hypothetical protein [Rhizobium leguminosarum]NKM77628.1 hypothetical protein [Rhizobium leguminosarum bv. viciae]QSZ09935.1 hypothetical protein J3P71_09345 [Rhizobium leguminosarum]